VGYIVVRDREGEVLAHTCVPEIPAVLLPPDEMVDTVRVRHLDIPQLGRFIDVTAPILHGEIGQLHVGMDQGIIDRAFWGAVWRQGVVGGVIIVLIMIVSLSMLVRSMHVKRKARARD
jgi:hypothetical protein